MNQYLQAKRVGGFPRRDNLHANTPQLWRRASDQQQSNNARYAQYNDGSSLHAKQFDDRAHHVPHSLFRFCDVSKIWLVSLIEITQTEYGLVLNNTEHPYNLFSQKSHTKKRHLQKRCPNQFIQMVTIAPYFKALSVPYHVRPPIGSRTITYNDFLSLLCRMYV